jgi:hypothetical protein
VLGRMLGMELESGSICYIMLLGGRTIISLANMKGGRQLTVVDASLDSSDRCLSKALVRVTATLPMMG